MLGRVTTRQVLPGVAVTPIKEVVLTQSGQDVTTSLTVPAGGSVRPPTLKGRVESIALDFPLPARPEAGVRDPWHLVLS